MNSPEQRSGFIPSRNEGRCCDTPKRYTLFFTLAIAVALFRLWLVSAYYLMATYTPHDDYLFVLLAEHLLKGQWLGDFNNVTLSKGVGYPIFLALANLLSIPALTFQQVFYTLACFVALFAFRPVVKSRVLLFVIFIFLLFNPMSYNHSQVRLFRLGLTVPLVIVTFSCMLGLLTRRSAGFRNCLGWSFGLGIACTWLWYTREEGIWILPSVGLFSLLFLFAKDDKGNLTFKKRIVTLFIPVIIFTIATLGIGYANYTHYGRFMINELKSKEFISAYGGLMNVVAGENIRTVPVKNEQLQKAMEVSPTLMELKDLFDQNAKGWPPSFFIWTLREVAAKAGYYKDLDSALNFYDTVGKEISDGCTTGKLECLDRKPTLQPPWFSEYNAMILPVFLQLYTGSIEFTNFKLDFDKFFSRRSWEPANRSIMQTYKHVTNETLLPSDRRRVKEIPEYVTHLREEKVRILRDIGSFYQNSIPYLLILAYAVHVFLLIRCLWKKSSCEQFWFGSVLIGGALSLLAVLTFVKITLWPVTRPLYPVYSVLLLYISYMAAAMVNAVRKQRGTQPVNH